MAKSTRQYVFDGMEHLPAALAPFVEKRLDSSLSGHWQIKVQDRYQGLRTDGNGAVAWDQQALLKVMNIYWMEAFSGVLGQAERAIVNELIAVRNRLAHDDKFNYDDAERALDSMRRLMEAISAGDAALALGRMRDTILRTKFTELRRNEERRKTPNTEISVGVATGLQPWREVVAPHHDVAAGEFQQAEFAADLAKVYNGSAPAEYGEPVDFFARTYLTDGLGNLLVGAVRRLSGTGGDPVVDLQTNFGGGKTHSMLALYHMVGETSTRDLPGLDQLLTDNGLTIPEKISRAVLVGTSRGPQDIIRPRGGPTIRTTWGELAWQLGGQDAFDLIVKNDESGIAPGSNLLEEIFRKCSPCLILIDEWVAYLRQIYKVDGLASGSFDANLSFVQSLTEAVKASPQTLVVASLPASQIEVGGEGGQEALARLKQTFARVESAWRPASQEESYEIVRRRLFTEIPGDRYQHRDNTLLRFAKMYRDNSSDFPQGSADQDYRRKMEKAYPIHPELFDQLYTSWASLETFQRTRGVLRLMAQVIHELWISNDPSVLIMPGSVAVESARVEPELVRYLNAQWPAIIASDVDGRSSTPLTIDQRAPNLGKYSAARRVARAIFMGTAPSQGQKNKGLDDKQINLGVVQPGERPAIFGDALRRLANQAKFMHTDLGRYWYSENQSLNRLAADRAGQIEDALVTIEVDRTLTAYINGLGNRGYFNAVHVAPDDSSVVPDEADGVRAVVLGVDYPHTGRDGSDAQVEAQKVLMQRGNMPRVFRNMLVFLAADKRQLDNVNDAMRAALGWAAIVNDIERLNLTQSDSALAKSRLDDTNQTVATRIKEAWCHLLYPWQQNPQSDPSWESTKVSAQDGLLERASKKLVSDENLFPELGPMRLTRDLQKHIWKDKDHLLLRDLWEYLSRYTYLPRLKDKGVLVRTVQAAVGNLVPGPFAYAERYDEASGKYAGLVTSGFNVTVVIIDSESVIVKPAVAEAQSPSADAESGNAPAPHPGPGPQPDILVAPPDGPVAPPTDKLPTRFIGTVILSPERSARDMQRVIEGIVEQLTTIPGATVELKLEIDADISSGINKHKSRTLLENASTLGFIDKELK